MALDKTRLKNTLAPLIESEMRAKILNGDAAPYPNLSKFAEALGKAIADCVIDEIKNHGQLNASFSGILIGVTDAFGGVSTNVVNQPVTGTLG